MFNLLNKEYEKLLVDLIDKMPKRTRCPDYQPDDSHMGRW